jgi:ubiquinone/menaquinone biosynthesis C-methylase UbiE
MEPLVNYFKDKIINTVLDTGSGNGGFIPVLKQTFPNAKITGIDPDTSSIETARQNFPEVIFHEMRAEKLLFEDNFFDVAAISMALHHLPRVKKGLKEMRRVVKPEGWLIINEMISNNLNPAQEVHKMYHHFRSRVDRLTGVYHRKSFTKEAILQLLKFSNIHVQFLFEYNRNVNLVQDPEDLKLRIQKMEQSLEQIKDRPEYEIMKPEIEKFRTKALKYGFQPATNLVIVARK